MTFIFYFLNLEKKAKAPLFLLLVFEKKQKRRPTVQCYEERIIKSRRPQGDNQGYSFF